MGRNNGTATMSQTNASEGDERLRALDLAR